MRLQQMCANERCENLVPAQIGPKLCRSCERGNEHLPEPRDEREYIDELEAENAKLATKVSILTSLLRDIETCAICEFLKQGVEN